MLVALIAVPLAFAGLALAVPSARVRPWLLPAGGAAHAATALAVAAGPDASTMGGWVAADAPGRLFSAFIGVLWFLCSLYAPAYLALRNDRPNRVFCASMLVALATMTLVVTSRHLGLMWVALETTTLACAPLVYFNRNAKSLEATWKYLMLGSVGVALALLGSFFLAYSALHAGLGSSLLFDHLVAQAPRLSRPWLHAAFIVLFVGYGTKMGLAPLHTWKPDAYGEAPGLAGALLAGGVTSCAFAALLRFYRIVNAAGDGPYARRVMIAAGLVSMAFAAVFVVRQTDYKRLLAYSSVEHMGILVLGTGLGGAGLAGALFHMINNGLSKGALFLSAGNIQRAYESKTTDHVSGALRRLPVSAAVFFGGFLAASAVPPFGTFLSEFAILNAALDAGCWGVAAGFLLLLAVVFAGMGATVLAVVHGRPSELAAASDRLATWVPAAAFLAAALVLGVWMPEPLARLLADTRAFVEGRP
jgi:hydrogenase-4 component F